MTVIKTFFATCLLIMVLQIEVNQKTLESRLHHWLQTSPVTQELQEVAKGVVVAARDIYRKAEEGIKGHFAKEEQGLHKDQKASRL